MKNFDYKTINQTNEFADIQLLDWVNGADYEESEVIPQPTRVA